MSHSSTKPGSDDSESFVDIESQSFDEMCDPNTIEFVNVKHPDVEFDPEDCFAQPFPRQEGAATFQSSSNAMHENDKPIAKSRREDGMGLSLAKLPGEPEYAGFWIRASASVLDALLFWGLIMGIAYANSFFWEVDMKAVFVTLLGAKSHPDYDEIYALLNLFAVLPLLYLWSRFQASPGKMLMKIRIKDFKTGDIPTKRQILLRALGYLASSIPFLLGFIWVGVDVNKRGWHDYIAGTCVIKINKYVDKTNQ